MNRFSKESLQIQIKEIVSTTCIGQFMPQAYNEAFFKRLESRIKAEIQNIIPITCQADVSAIQMIDNKLDFKIKINTPLASPHVNFLSYEVLSPVNKDTHCWEDDYLFIAGEADTRCSVCGLSGRKQDIENVIWVNPDNDLSCGEYIMKDVLR